MRFQTTVLLSVYLAVSWAHVTTEQQSTRGTHVVGRGVKVETYHPASSFETFGEGIAHPARKQASISLEDASKAFVISKLGIHEDNVSFNSGTDGTGSGTKVGFLKQSHNGTVVSNAVANVAFGEDDRVTSFGSSFIKPDAAAASVATIPVDTAISIAEEQLEGKWNKIPIRTEYLARPDNTLALNHVIQIQNDETSLWVEAFVDAHSGQLLQVTNFVADVTYRVIPFPKVSPPDGFEEISDPVDAISSPFGWHSDGTTNFTVTSGNNAIAFTHSLNTISKESAPGEYIYQFDPGQGAESLANQDSPRVNAFYIVNSLHDITYRYGFTEKTFNFQKTNIETGGKANDLVTISVQDTNGKNNAQFATPEDGQNGHMYMFIFDKSNPTRDSALENTVITHEMTHGITNRMTGGGTANCLQTDEARGLGEGWGDAFALWHSRNSSATPDAGIATYVSNKPAGLRTKLYSLDFAVNPYTYSFIKGKTEEHGIGEVWANLLVNVYGALVQKYGWSETARTNPDGTEGNVVWLHLFLDALLLQPCQPTFVSARAAWIQADVNRYGSTNKCLLWKVFASRGLGLGANATTHDDDFTLPEECN
ncbi:Fungalysin metallopeptidase-domain-containing protein [Flagelloscypha sp. PMI_526]|nr:Fungalysin metallopeptidase-domain-containing protein [Flagelloscypha sp. PMI_526]